MSGELVWQCDHCGRVKPRLCLGKPPRCKCGATSWSIATKQAEPEPLAVWGLCVVVVILSGMGLGCLIRGVIQAFGG